MADVCFSILIDHLIAVYRLKSTRKLTSSLFFVSAVLAKVQPWKR